MRKHRRKIERKLRKGKSKRRKNWALRHLDSPITSRFAKIHTYLILIVDTIFMLICAYWAHYEIFRR